MFVTILLIIGSLNCSQVIFIPDFDVTDGHDSIKKNNGPNAKMQDGFRSGLHRVRVKLSHNKIGDQVTKNCGIFNYLSLLRRPEILRLNETKNLLINLGSAN